METIVHLVSQMGKAAVSIIETTGYGGIAFLMALESTMVPLPSELVMPFAGFLATEGKLDFKLVVVFSGLGSLAGSLVSYVMGRFGGLAVVRTVGKYVLLDEEDLDTSQRWFARNGEMTIFICRFVPVIRHFISIPAGIARMDIVRFCLYTVAGATIWNAILAYAGYLLGEHWEKIHHYMRPASLAVFCVLLASAAWFFYKHVARKMLARSRATNV